MSRVIVPLPSQPKLDTRRYGYLTFFAISAVINIVNALRLFPNDMFGRFIPEDILTGIYSFGIACSIVAFILLWNESYWSKTLGFKERKYNEWGEVINNE